MKIRYSQLKQIVVEEMISLGLLPTLTEGEDKLDAVEDEEGTEIEPGEEGRLKGQKQIDALKARQIKELKLKEAKLLRALGETRSQLRRGQK